MEGNSSVHLVYPVSLIIREGRAEILRAWGAGAGGAGFEKEGAAGAEGGQLNLCA